MVGMVVMELRVEIHKLVLVVLRVLAVLLGVLPLLETRWEPYYLVLLVSVAE
jgi:hypothetical protein